MSKERPKSPRARMFIALDLPDEVRSALAAWQAAECRDPALRPVPQEQLHITLCFLGWQRVRDEEPIAALLEDAAGSAVEIRLHRDPVGRPERGRPRLFALVAESPAAISLQGAISAGLEGARLHEPEKRPFWPHVTAARVRPERTGEGGRGRRRGRPRRVESPPGALPATLERPFGAVRLALYRSNLRPQGARYTPLATMDLPPLAAER